MELDNAIVSANTIFSLCHLRSLHFTYFCWLGHFTNFLVDDFVMVVMAAYIVTDDIIDYGRKVCLSQSLRA